MSAQIIPFRAIALSLNQSLSPEGCETLVGQTWLHTQLPALKKESV